MSALLLWQIALPPRRTQSGATAAQSASVAHWSVHAQERRASRSDLKSSYDPTLNPKRMLARPDQQTSAQSRAAQGEGHLRWSPPWVL
jgi:hypothetical protein